MVGERLPWLPPGLPASELGEEGTNSGAVGLPTKEPFCLPDTSWIAGDTRPGLPAALPARELEADEGTNSAAVGLPTGEVEVLNWPSWSLDASLTVGVALFSLFLFRARAAAIKATVSSTFAGRFMLADLPGEARDEAREDEE